jgi:RNA polymerase sigma-70 factor (ECF subfamily)
MCAAATHDTCAIPDPAHIRRYMEKTAKGRVLRLKAPLVSGGVARMDICSKPEPNTEEQHTPSSVEEQEMLGEIAAELTFNLAEDCGVAEDKAWDRDQGQAKLSGDLQVKMLTLYDEYRPRLLRYMRSMHLGLDSAEEVIQETFMRLTIELLKGTDIENVQGWIVRVAHNLAIDLLKKRREAAIADERVAFVIENRADSSLSPEEAYSKKEQSIKMKTALFALKPLHRQCFQMRAQGLRYKDIGLAFGISEQRVAFIVKQVTVRLAAACE